MSDTAIRVVRGKPTDADLATLLVVLAAAAADAPIASHPPMTDLGGWGAPIQLLRYGLSAAPTLFVNARHAR